MHIPGLSRDKSDEQKDDLLNATAKINRVITQLMAVNRRLKRIEETLNTMLEVTQELDEVDDDVLGGESAD